jgi:PAS domain S-box-containing protein
VITGTDGTIEYVNPKFTSLTGYSREEVMGANPRILKSGEQPVGFYADLWKTITSGREWRGEFHNRKKNGEYYWEFASISPLLDEKGAITHYIAVKEDITARKEAEDALRRSEEKLRSRNLQMEKDLKIAQAAQKELLRADIPDSPYMKCAYRYEPL